MSPEIQEEENLLLPTEVDLYTDGLELEDVQLFNGHTLNLPLLAKEPLIQPTDLSRIPTNHFSHKK